MVIELKDIPRYDRSLLMGDEIHVKKGSSFNDVELHWHDYYELIIYYDADVFCCINGEDFSLFGNSVYLLTPYDFHKTTNLRADNTIDFLNISFAENAFENDVIGRIKNTRLVRCASKDDPIIRISRLIAELGQNSKEYAISLTKVLIGLICDRGESVYGIDGSSRNDFIKKVSEYVAENFKHSISLKTVSEYMHLAPAYFSSRFSKVTGYTFVRYLTVFRLNYAKELLIVGDKSITDICFESGFSNLSHFLRTFKDYFGVTPSCYRKRYYTQKF